MAGRFKTINRDTAYLMPPSVQDWLPEGHLARFVVEIIDDLDLSALERQYSGRGKDAYHPAALLGLLVYGYATGVFSSRQLERATYESVAFRFVAGNEHPDHDTIANFRRRFLPQLEGLFVQVLVLAQAMGLLKLGKISVDGSKFKANASKHKALSYRYASELEKQLLAEVQELMSRAEQTDSAEEDQPLDIPAELQRREQRREALAQARAELERRARERHAQEQAEYEQKLAKRQAREEETGKKPGGRPPQPPSEGPRDKDQVNLTDEDSRIMPSPDGGFVQAYNAQAGVDVDTHLVVSAHLSQAPNDKQEVEPALERLAALEGVLGKPEALLADSGYFSQANVEACARQDITPYLCEKRERHNRPLAERLDSTCPPPPPEDADALTQMRHRLATPEGKAVYAKRKSTVETVFGIIKQVLGFRQFQLRGLAGARGEWNLVCLAWNLKRMHALAG